MNAIGLTYPLETERLLLRPFAPGDFDALYAYQSRPDVTRYLYWGPRTEDEVREALEKKLVSTAIRSEGDVLCLAVVLKESHELVGDFILHFTSEEHEQAEIGYIIHPDQAGHGYATEAGQVLLRIAFRDLGLHRVTGSTDARNTASGRVLEKLGMRREAHFVENEYVKDGWQSETVYAMLDREWFESAGS
ncbi:MAG: GNAT family N-acetyltransferase [Actinomycetota bacterium]